MLVDFNREIAKSLKIEIPESLKQLFSKEGNKRYIPSKINNTEISYSGVIGNNPKRISEKEMNEKQSFLSCNEYEFDNNSEESNKKAKRTIDEITLFLQGQKYPEIQRLYMTSGATIPIKIALSETKKLPEKSVYVKKPDSNRIVGFFLYNIINPREFNNFAFNELAFIENGFKANPLVDLDESLLLPDEAYIQGIGKAAAHVEFLAMAQDVAAPWNRLIDAENNTVLFDFDSMFLINQKTNENHLLAYYAKLNDHNHVTPTMVNAYVNEKKKINERIEENLGLIQEFSRLLSELPVRGFANYNNKIRAYSKSENLEQYIKKRALSYHNA